MGKLRALKFRYLAHARDYTLRARLYALCRFCSAYEDHRSTELHVLRPGQLGAGTISSAYRSKGRSTTYRERARRVSARVRVAFWGTVAALLYVLYVRLFRG